MPTPKLLSAIASLVLIACHAGADDSAGDQRVDLRRLRRSYETADGVQTYVYRYGAEDHIHYASAEITDQDGALLYTATSEHDEEGFHQLVSWYDADGAFVSGYAYEYDHQEFLPLRKTTYLADDPLTTASPAPSSELRWEYDDLGHLTRQEYQSWADAGDGSQTISAEWADRYYLSDYALRGVGSNNFPEYIRSYGTNGELEEESFSEFDEHGYPSARHYDTDGDGEVDRSDWYQATVDDDGSIQRLAGGWDAEDRTGDPEYYYEFVYEGGLGCGHDSWSKDATGEFAISSHTEVAWHANPVGGPSGDRLVRNQTDPDGAYLQEHSTVEWSETSLVITNYDEGTWYSTETTELERVAL